MDRRNWLKKTGGLSAGIGACLLGCRSAPLTDRRQLMLVGEQRELSLGEQAYADVLKEAKFSTNTRQQNLVQRVGQRLADASGRSDYNWETHLVADAEQNAFCLPGGKIIVNEGILPICQNEAGLAVVMGHEVAHVLARHGGERMSQQAAVNGVKTVVGYAMRNQEEVSKDAWMRAYGMATELGVVLPYSRKHESEADHIGLMLMASSGYDPTESVKFWMRFSAASSGPTKAEFLSTHPADERRASDLEKRLPDALDSYRQAQSPIGVGELIV